MRINHEISSERICADMRQAIPKVFQQWEMEFGPRKPGEASLRDSSIQVIRAQKKSHLSDKDYHLE